VQARLQTATAVLAVAAAIAMLGLTLVVPRKSLLTSETPLAYDAAFEIYVRSARAACASAET
jgi:hypothetical protein